MVNSSRSILLGLSFMTFSLGAPAYAWSSKDVTDIRQLMNDYHIAVVNHDGNRLTGLFVPTGSAWFNVLSEPAYKSAQVKSPNAPKARPSDVASFVKFVNTTKALLDPKHGPVKIQTDGSIASAYFKFRFLVDGKVQNTGSESWQMVKSSDGWRIASIIYSSNPTVM